MHNCVIAPIDILAFSSHLSAREILTGSIFKKWRCDVELAPSLVDLDMCLLQDKSTISSDNSSSSSKAKLEKWERYKCLSLMIIKTYILNAICGGIPSCETTKEFLDAKYRSPKSRRKQKSGIFQTVILILDMITLENQELHFENRSTCYQT